MRKNKKQKKNNPVKNGGFVNNAVVMPDGREDKSNMAVPSQENVERARDFDIENKK